MPILVYSCQIIRLSRCSTLPRFILSLIFLNSGLTRMRPILRRMRLAEFRANFEHKKVFFVCGFDLNQNTVHRSTWTKESNKTKKFKKKKNWSKSHLHGHINTWNHNIIIQIFHFASLSRPACNNVNQSRGLLCSVFSILLFCVLIVWALVHFGSLFSLYSDDHTRLIDCPLEQE